MSRWRSSLSPAWMATSPSSSRGGRRRRRHRCDQLVEESLVGQTGRRVIAGAGEARGRSRYLGNSCWRSWPARRPAARRDRVLRASSRRVRASRAGPRGNTPRPARAGCRRSAGTPWRPLSRVASASSHAAESHQRVGEAEIGAAYALFRFRLVRNQLAASAIVLLLQVGLAEVARRDLGRGVGGLVEGGHELRLALAAACRKG